LGIRNSELGIKKPETGNWECGMRSSEFGIKKPETENWECGMGKDRKIGRMEE
jgi:hypothetical protein